MTAHIVWDWNGTLFDDTEAVVAASNAAFAEWGVGPLTVAEYRELYRVPVIDFYEERLRRRPEPAEWARMDAVFHEHYTARRDTCAPAAGVPGLLASWAEGGAGTQSLLSMYGHDELVPLVRRLGLEPFFLRVDGRDGTSGVSGKGEYLARHLRLLGARVDPARTVLIGDVADDAVAATAAGVRAVLYSGGSGSRRELGRSGAPVVDTLAEAVALAQTLSET